MTRIALALAVGATLGGLAGCGHHSGSITVAHGKVTVYDREVRIRSSGAADASITADGALTIGDRAVTLSAEQTAAADAYFKAATSIGQHGIETGKAGADAGMTAAKEVVSGLVHGDTSQIEPRVKAKAEEVKRQAMHICEDLAGMRASQEALAASLAAFHPYAVIDAEEVSDCGKDLKN